MSGISKRVSGSWVSGDYGIMKTATDTLTTLPAVLYPNAATATVGLKGNTTQSGTPTPYSPIMPQGTGERTGNLLNLSSYSGTSAGISNIVISGNSITFNASLHFLAIVYEFNLGITDIYTLALGGDSFHTRLEIRYTKNGTNVGSTIVIQPSRNAIISGSDKYDGFRVYISNANNIGTCTASNIMLNTGSEALPYEHYGYKIPISSANTTTNVYLGEVQTTRKVKKLVLTGEESWNTHNSTYYITVSDYYRMYDIGSHLSVCSHYPDIQVMTLPEMHYGLGGLVDGSTHTAWNGNIVFNPSPMISSLTDWKAYLAQQYAAGTPVTIWYVLEAPETGIVNEPLMKIGDYADTVSGITIPTIAGANTLSVDTTLQPSEVTANYHGWHPVQSVHEYDSNYTIATMQALTIAQLQSHTIGDLEGGGWA